MQNNHHSSAYQVNFIKQLKQYTFKLQQLIGRLSAIANRYYSKKASSSINQQLNQYQDSLKNIEKQRGVIRQITKISKKLELQIEKYKGIMVKLDNKLLAKGAINGIKSYIDSNFNTLIKQSYQIINMCQNRVEIPKTTNLTKIKEYELQMDGDWDAVLSRRAKANNQNYNTMNSLNQTFVNNSMNHKDLHQVAASQINKQFLAIRLVAYKLFEQYNGHSHDKLHKELQVLIEEENKLEKQIDQMKQIRGQLQTEQNKIWKQLVQIKKINQLIGRRHFISNGRFQTNFSNNL